MRENLPIDNLNDLLTGLFFKFSIVNRQVSVCRRAGLIPDALVQSPV
jgi:hypothetical protein